MKIIQSWKNSLQLLSPAQLKPFLLVTVKSVLHVYQNMNKPLSSRSNWIVIGTVLGLVGLTNFLHFWYLFWLEALILNGMHYVLFFIFLLGLRASVGLKDQDYFFDYIKKFRFAFLATIVLGLTPFFAIPFLQQWYMFMLLFLFDSSESLKDIVKAKTNAAKLILYNFPVCLALEFVLAVVGLILYKVVAFALGYWGGLALAAIAYLLLLPIQAALICNFYIKKFHEQSDLYLNQHIG